MANTPTNHKALLWRITRHIQDMDATSDYEGTEAFVDAEIDIHNGAIKLGIVDQDWYDNRLKHTFHELLCELIYVIGLHHMKQQVDKIIIEHEHFLPS
jgi:hypothetical protein